MWVSRKLHESSNVTSLVLEPADGQPLTAALAGQFIVLRLRPRPDESALLRSHSLSGAPSEDRYRISVKREPQGCRTGVCHNCETGLISGSVIYRPDPVEPPADGNLLICCSQPQGDIALDL